MLPTPVQSQQQRQLGSSDQSETPAAELIIILGKTGLHLGEVPIPYSPHPPIRFSYTIFRHREKRRGEGAFPVFFRARGTRTHSRTRGAREGQSMG